MLNVRNKRVVNATQDQKYSKKFKKYLVRTATIVDGTNKKIPATPVFSLKSDFTQENL